MVGQITYQPAQLTSITASPSAPGSVGSAPEEKSVAEAKATIAQLRAKLQVVSSDNPNAASRIASEIDNAAREYRAAGGIGPIPGVPPEISHVRNQSLEDGSDTSQRQAGVDIRV